VAIWAGAQTGHICSLLDFFLADADVHWRKETRGGKQASKPLWLPGAKETQRGPRRRHRQGLVHSTGGQFGGEKRRPRKKKEGEKLPLELERKSAGKRPLSA